MKKFLSILMAAAMLLSVCALSACGGSEEPAPEAEGTEVTEPTEGDAAFTTLEDGVLIMSTNAAFPPYEMTTDAGGFEGIDIEIATAIAEKLGARLRMTADGSYAALYLPEGVSIQISAGSATTQNSTSTI